jgi:hypothetical protein
MWVVVRAGDEEKSVGYSRGGVAGSDRRVKGMRRRAGGEACGEKKSLPAWRGWGMAGNARRGRGVRSGGQEKSRRGRREWDFISIVP